MRNLYVIPFDEDHYTTILKGDYEGRHYEIVSYNGYPCAYVAFPEGEYVKDTGLIDRDVNVHVEISYLGKREEDGPIMIGWDYGHKGDYNARHPEKVGVKYNLHDVSGDVYEVIEALNAAYR